MIEFLDKNHCVKEIVLATLVPAGLGGAIHKNRPSHGLAFNTAGIKKYYFPDGSVYTVGENDVIYLPLSSFYRVMTETPGDIYCINFRCTDNETFPPFVLHVKKPKKLLDAYATAEKAWKKKESGVQIKCLAQLYEILYELHKEISDPYLPDSKLSVISPAMEYIHKYYAEKLINTEELAALCGISYEYLRRLFVNFFGDTPLKYVNSLKIDRAKELLSSGLYSVSDAAFGSGFSDVSHFSRVFKKQVGISPNEYKNVSR